MMENLLLIGSLVIALIGSIIAAITSFQASKHRKRPNEDVRKKQSVEEGFLKSYVEVISLNDTEESKQRKISDAHTDSETPVEVRLSKDNEDASRMLHLTH